MTKYKIKLYSKNKETINNVLKFFNQSQNKIKNFPITLNFKRKKKRKNIITILKSPHVNKKAQTQFQQITYIAVGKYLSWNKKKSTICLKKLKNNLFPGLKIKIEKTSILKNNSKKTLFARFSLVKNPSLLSFFSKKKQALIFKNQKITTKKWKNRILKNLKRLDTYGHQSKKIELG
uniref:ribosomal protein S10 n=1 Tax=Navicula tsukamotoi TaxID=2018706 RepID=UPI002029646A|nr:ribosomal protein S10 [Navicula tsukamotoi]QYB23087.1 ribosomal protein S10 [Navicula tsukamotoi]